MADSKLNQFVASGTNAERVAFTPVPPTPASGPDQGYFFYETDTGNTYSWDGSAWDQVNATGSAATTTDQLTGADNTKRATSDSVAALWEQGSDVASAATISIGEGGYFNITGTTTITDIDFATDKAGRKAVLKFAGALTLTHNASTLILPTGANITTAAGDTATFISEGSDVVRCVSYQRASGAALVGGGAVTLIEEKTPSGVATVTFSAIPGTYRALKLVWTVRSANAATSDTISIQFNGDTGSNYDRQLVGGSGASASASESLAATSAAIANVAGSTAPAGAAGVGEMVIPYYAGTDFQKGGVSTFVYRTGTASGTVITRVIGIDWRDTSAITSITLAMSGNYVSGSKIALYGIS